MLDFEDWCYEGDRRKLYGWLGMTPKMAETADDLQIRWDFHARRLKIAQRFSEDDEALQKVELVMLDTWHFPEWNSARWCSMGPGARNVMLSLFSGLIFLWTGSSPSPATPTTTSAAL